MSNEENGLLLLESVPATVEKAPLPISMVWSSSARFTYIYPFRVDLGPSNFSGTIRIHFCRLELRTLRPPGPGLSRLFRPDNHYLHGQIQILSFSFQVLIKILQTPYLSSSCCKMLLNTFSAFLLAENVLLPDSLTKEAVQKVTRIAAYARNPRLQIP